MSGMAGDDSGSVAPSRRNVSDGGTVLSSRPKVGIFTRPIDQGTSGSGHHLSEMVRHILDLNEAERRFDITLIHYEKNDREIYRRAPELIVPRSPLASARMLRPHRFDLLHHSPLTMFSPVHVRGAVHVATIHSAEPNIIPQYYSVPARLHARWIKPRYARRMDHIFTVSETSKRYFVEHWRVQPERVSITYNACSPAYRVLGGRGKAESLPVLRRLGVEGPYLFHISKYSPRKNPDCILGGFATLCERDAIPGLRLVLAGSRWRNPSVESFIERRRLTDRIVFPGFIPEEEVVELFNGAVAFIFPSRAEGFGMPNVEAMACGCPVVTSNAFALPEIVGDGALVMSDPDDYRDLADKVERIYRDDALRNDLIERGLTRAGEFSWEKSARTVLDTWARLIDRAR